MFGLDNFGYRYFTTVDTEEDIKELQKNPFVMPFDIVMTRDKNMAYPLLSYSGKALSKHEQYKDDINIYRMFRIGEVIQLKKKDGTVSDVQIEDIIYKLSSHTAYYVLKYTDNNTVETIPVRLVDATYSEQTATSIDDVDIPLSSLLR